MENDQLKSIWKGFDTPQKSETVLIEMFKERNHPVLKAIKKQAIFELVAFTLFLFCYYTMFDGLEKPLFINIILITAILVNMLHHFRGYQLQQKFRASNNLKDDLSSFTAKLKSYQLETLFSKIIWVGGLMVFFTHNIQFTSNKWWAFAAIVIVLVAQLFLLNRNWGKRITQIKMVIKQMEST